MSRITDRGTIGCQWLRDATALPRSGGARMAQSPHSSNHLLASLPADKMAAFLPHLRVIELPHETVLFERGDSINAVYFPHNCLVSLVVGLSSGEIIEAAMIGCDSVAGASAAFGNKISLNKAIVQVPGSASALDVDRFCALADQNDGFKDTLARHEQFILAQAQQSAACNATHTLEARMARWLLTCRDFLRSDDILLTQEFLAEMLGVRRTSVTLVASALQHAGLIRYRRGHIRVFDVEGLRGCACECYETLKSEAERLLGASS
jgi:CRP-like cAMP-binding protein